MGNCVAKSGKQNQKAGKKDKNIRGFKKYDEMLKQKQVKEEEKQLKKEKQKQRNKQNSNLVDQFLTENFDLKKSEEIDQNQMYEYSSRSKTISTSSNTQPNIALFQFKQKSIQQQKQNKNPAQCANIHPKSPNSDQLISPQMAMTPGLNPNRPKNLRINTNDMNIQRPQIQRQVSDNVIPFSQHNTNNNNNNNVNYNQIKNINNTENMIINNNTENNMINNENIVLQEQLQQLILQNLMQQQQLLQTTQENIKNGSVSQEEINNIFKMQMQQYPQSQGQIFMGNQGFNSQQQIIYRGIPTNKACSTTNSPLLKYGSANNNPSLNNIPMGTYNYGNVGSKMHSENSNQYQKQINNEQLGGNYQQYENKSQQRCSIQNQIQSRNSSLIQYKTTSLGSYQQQQQQKQLAQRLVIGQKIIGKK